MITRLNKNQMISYVYKINSYFLDGKKSNNNGGFSLNWEVKDKPDD